MSEDRIAALEAEVKRLRQLVEHLASGGRTRAGAHGLEPASGPHLVDYAASQGLQSQYQIAAPPWKTWP